MSTQNIAIVFVLAALSLGIGAVSMFVVDEDSRIAEADRSIDDLTLTLTRTACFGPCPVYTLSVFNDGSAQFDGLAFTDIEGVAVTRLSGEQMAAIADEIVDSNFFQYKVDDQCVVFATDHPSVKLEILWHGRTRSADVNVGCEKRMTDPIPHLSNRIDEIVNTMQWIGATEKNWR
jgi:hypothetical protein